MWRPFCFRHRAGVDGSRCGERQERVGRLAGGRANRTASQQQRTNLAIYRLTRLTNRPPSYNPSPSTVNSGSAGPRPACRSRGGSPGRSTGVRFLRYVSVVRRARVLGNGGVRRTRNGSWRHVEADRVSEMEAPEGAEPLRGRRGRPRTGNPPRD